MMDMLGVSIRRLRLSLSLVGKHISLVLILYLSSRYRFKGKPISAYMSLTLARLCGEWRLERRLVSGNYESKKAMNQQELRSSGNEWRDIRSSTSDLLYTCHRKQILSYFSESRKPLRKIGKPSKKAENHKRKRKAIEEIGKPLKKIFLDFSKIGKLLKKIEFCVRKIGVQEKENPNFPKIFSRFWQFRGLVFDTRFATTCAHGFT